MDELARMGFRLVGHLKWSENGLLADIDNPAAEWICSVYAIVFQDRMLRIGASKKPLRSRIRSYRTYIMKSIKCEGVGTPTPLWEALRWKELLLIEPAEIWARPGSLVRTPLGQLNAYLTEERALIQRYKPELNRSSR